MERPPDFRHNLSSLVVRFVKPTNVISVNGIRSCVVFFRHVRFFPFVPLPVLEVENELSDPCHPRG
jgi:hypothetical protein